VYLTPRGSRLENVDDIEFADPYTALSLRFREPEIFTMQFDANRFNLRFPGKVPDLSGKLSAEEVAWMRYSNVELSAANLSKQVDEYAQKAKAKLGPRELYFGNIGVMLGVDDASARIYLQALRDALERNGIAWAVYDYQTGGAVRAEQGTGGPTRVLEGLRMASGKQVNGPASK
jgi:hypothetical protein